MSPKVSIILPSYNREMLANRALQSLISQQGLSDKSYEIILVDDGSSDGTQQMVSNSFPQVRYIYQKNAGVSAARNTGIQNARYEWLAFLDSDDVWLPNKLAKQWQQLQQSGLLISHTNEQWIRNGTPLKQEKKHRKKGGWIFQHCLPMCLISPSSVLMHKKVLDEVGVFDESLPACEDYDMWLRITSQYCVDFIDESLIIKYGGHPDQLSKKYWGMDRFRVQALKNILKSNLSEENRQAAKMMLVRKLTILLQGAKKHGNDAMRTFCQLELAEVGC